MKTTEIIERGRAYHAYPCGQYDELRKNYDAEQKSLERGMAVEAKRSRTRRAQILNLRTRPAGRKNLAMKRASKRDPLSNVNQTLQRAGEILRDHAVAPSLSTTTPTGVSVQGGVPSSYEAKVDRRMRGRIAWNRALDAIKDQDFRSSVEKMLTHRLSFVRAAEACLLYTSPSPRDQRGSRMPSSA